MSFRVGMFYNSNSDNFRQSGYPNGCAYLDFDTLSDFVSFVGGDYTKLLMIYYYGTQGNYNVNKALFSDDFYDCWNTFIQNNCDNNAVFGDRICRPILFINNVSGGNIDVYNNLINGKRFRFKLNWGTNIPHPGGYYRY